MGVKVRGVSKVSNNINRLIDNIEKRKTMRALGNPPIFNRADK